MERVFVATGCTDSSSLAFFIENCSSEGAERIFAVARGVARRSFGNRVFIRGLIEFSNYCRQDCLYCGIRRSNARALRYRLSKEEILACCAQGHALGFRTFVLQGGEDPWFTDDRLVDIVSAIKAAWPDSAVTLSVGERPCESYEKFRRAGADRFLLRHESADPAHFASLHPAAQSLDSRVRCLYDLKKLAFQTGAGFMVGTPGQSGRQLVQDLEFLHALQPEMVGIGPFLPHADTPLGQAAPGEVQKTLLMLALTRILLPHSLLPATTALGTAAGDGRERGILAGANVLMPNLSPPEQREKYMLYNGKIHSQEEAAENLAELKRRIAAIGYEIVQERGDFQGEKYEPA